MTSSQPKSGPQNTQLDLLWLAWPRRNGNRECGAGAGQPASIFCCAEPASSRRFVTNLERTTRLAAENNVRIAFQPAGRALHVPKGTLITAAANQAGVALEQVCGGRGTCGKCRVRLLAGELSPVTNTEQRHLTADDLAGGYRLACQAAALGDCTVEVAWASADAAVSILVEGLQESLAIDPPVRKLALQVPPASLSDQVADYDALLRQLPALQDGRSWQPTVGAVRELPDALRAAGGLLTVVCCGDRVLAVEPEDTSEAVYGLACDIGTTTVVAYLLDLLHGKRVAVASTLNPQTRFGDDVVSRIDVAQKDVAGLEGLRAAIVKAINELLEQTAQEAGIRREQVYAVSVVGNTCMHHLFLGLSPVALGRSPYVPVISGSLQLDAAAVGLCAHPSAQLFVLPNIAGFVGADTVGVLLATRLLQRDGIRLGIDIGTNGEMVLGSRERMLSCSTAAGPAFEGAQLAHGMRAADGAIDRVDVGDDGDLQVHTIGRGKARGVCGSGAVDAIAALRKLGVMDATGRLLSADEVRSQGLERMAERLVAHPQGSAVVLVPKGQTAIGGPIVLTQRDIRQIQLAKGAIRAGVEIMMKELAAKPEDVVEVCLAGAFGNYIRPESALTIGLFPRFPRAPITPVGNAAGAGAQMVLLNRRAWEEAAEIRAQVDYIELSLRQDFQHVFMEAMLFD